MLALSLLTLAIWLYLTFFNGKFWLPEPAPYPELPEVTPVVVAIIPARNEAETIAETIKTLLEQDYDELKIVLVDDESGDNTSEIARNIFLDHNRGRSLQIVKGEPRPTGWSGKVWAMHQGVMAAQKWVPDADYYLLSDADIHHTKGVVRRLAAIAKAENNDMVSYMVRLNCESASEKLLIPAFVYFFQMLYPFPRVNDSRSKVAAAAGGTILISRAAMERIGGFESMKDAIIDDCSLAALVKSRGHSIWLGLSPTSYSTRKYTQMSEIVQMISRTAFTQLRYSWLAVIISVVGLGITFLAPPVLTLVGVRWTKWLATAAWILMTATYTPMIERYRLSIMNSLLLPVAAVIYMYATLRSAILHTLGRGGEWKGRTHDS